MKCPICGNTQIKDDDNFCTECGTKVRNTCNCWIKKDNYDCGESSCPGYGLFKIERLRSESEQSLG